MGIEDWKVRLKAAIDQSGRSMRDVSLAAGLGPGYVHSIFKENKDPTVGSLFKVCRAVDVSIYYVLGGFEMDREKEEFLKLLLSADDAVKQSVLLLLRRGQKPVEDQEPPASIPPLPRPKRP